MTRVPTLEKLRQAHPHGDFEASNSYISRPHVKYQPSVMSTVHSLTVVLFMVPTGDQRPKKTRFIFRSKQANLQKSDRDPVPGPEWQREKGSRHLENCQKPLPSHTPLCRHLPMNINPKQFSESPSSCFFRLPECPGCLWPVCLSW